MSACAPLPYHRRERLFKCVQSACFGRDKRQPQRPGGVSRRLQTKRERATSKCDMRIAMESGCELGIVADRLLSLVGDDDRGALN